MDYTPEPCMPPAHWLDDFSTKGKIDFITIALPSAIKSEADARLFTNAIKGRICAADRWRDYRDDWLTIHDPTIADLQYLINNYPETEILALETAIDLFLKDGTNDPTRLSVAHRHITINLFPQAHARLKAGGKRKICVEDALGKLTIKLDTLKTGSGGKSVYWTDNQYREQVRAYVKTIDNKLPLTSQHSTRLEITLSRGGCQNAGIYRICQLPAFASQSRSYLSQFFKVAAGIKPAIRRTRSKNPEKIGKAVQAAAKAIRQSELSFARYGAATAAKNGKQIIIDRKASLAIGNALKALRDQLMTLNLPIKLAEMVEKWDHFYAADQDVGKSLTSVDIEALLSLPATITSYDN